MFKKGHKGYKTKGTRNKGGKPPDWLRFTCHDLIKKHKVVEYIGEVAGGGHMADNKERMEAAKILFDRGFGKPRQEMDISGELQGQKTIILNFPEGYKQEHGT